MYGEHCKGHTRDGDVFQGQGLGDTQQRYFYQDTRGGYLRSTRYERLFVG